MRTIALLTASLLLLGAGCAVDRQPEFLEQTPPAAQPATPSEESGQKAQPAAPATPPSGAIETEVEANLPIKASVSITGGGAFSPAILNIKQGTTVTWKNDGAMAVWPASDPHPTHTGYPGLDAQGWLEQGETWSFTFDKKGSWGYHNHLNPPTRGTIIVE